jgi:hypothetical protein
MYYMSACSMHAITNTCAAAAAAFCNCCCRYIFVEVPHGVLTLSEILAGAGVVEFV